MSDIFADFFMKLRPMATEELSYSAGADCGKNGPNTMNCHYSLFATPVLTRAWERGKREAEEAKGDET